MWQVSKNGNSALQAFYFWKYLLTVGGDEQQEMAISCYELPSRHPFLLSYRVTDGLRLCKHTAGRLMGNTW